MRAVPPAEARYLIARAKGIAVAREFFWAELPDEAHIIGEDGEPVMRVRTETVEDPRPRRPRSAAKLGITYDDDAGFEEPVAAMEGPQ